MSRPDWYYALDGEQKGPVSAEDFERLVEAGVVTPTTRVWSEGMANWQTLAEVRPTKPASEPLPPPTPPTHASDSSRCGLCGVAVTAEDSVRLDGRVVCAACKPRAVQMLREGVKPVNLQADQIRREHIQHEVSIKAVGTLYLFGACFVALLALLAGLGVGAKVFGGDPTGIPLGRGSLMIVLFGAISGVLFWVSLGFRRLRQSIRVVAVILAGVGLIGFPVGTLINGYILYLLLSKKGRMVFSDEYKRIIAETPEVRYRTPVIAWVVLALFIAAFVGAVLYFSTVR